MQQLPEACPVKDILNQISSILKLLDKIMEHCEKCLEKRKEDKDG